MDPVVAMNLVFDVVIVLLSIFSYGRRRSPILVWLAFCLFAASYALTIVGVANSLILTPMRAIRYLSIIAGIGMHHIQQRQSTEFTHAFMVALFKLRASRVSLVEARATFREFSPTIFTNALPTMTPSVPALTRSRTCSG